MMVLFAILVTILLFQAFHSRPLTYPVRELDDGWKITRNGVDVGASALTEVRADNVARGETFLLTRTLPEEDGLPQASLYFRNLHTAVKLWLDGELIYTSGVERYEKSCSSAGRSALCRSLKTARARSSRSR